MAIENTNGGIAEAQAPRVYSSNTEAPQAPQQQPQRKGWGFLSMGPLGGISRTPASEALTKARAVMADVLSKAAVDSKYKMHLLAIDNTTEIQLRLSSVVLVVVNEQDRKLGYHTVLLEASSDPMPPRVDNFQGQQITIDRFSSDVYDGRYSAAVAKLVTGAFAGFTAADCSAVVCPRNFNWDDKDGVRQFVNNALLPSISELEARSDNYQDIDLSAWNRDASLQAQVSFNEPTRTDYTGLPVRNDVVITLAAASNVAKDASTLNNQDRSVIVSQVGGFIDLLWAPAQDPMQQYGVVNPLTNQKFAARMVMTGMENHQRMGITAQLLSLASAFVLGEGNQWYPYYTPAPMVKDGRKVDTRDIGAINIEANISNDPSGYGLKIDTKSMNFNQLELGKLIQMTIRQGMNFSLDVSACGADTWYNEVFAAAASGNQGAMKAIYDAANRLTGGEFGRLMPSGHAPVLINDERILMGYYTGQDGTRRDIRDIDYLAVLNLMGEKDRGAAQAWSDTFTRLDYPIYKRLDARKRMISDLVGGDVHFTQTAQRVTFEGAFVGALSKAIQSVGVSIKAINPALTGEYVNNRGVADWISQSNVIGGGAGLFNSGFGGQTFAGQNRQFSDRW